jgi:serine/threonine protein phosphatase PrpC
MADGSTFAPLGKLKRAQCWHVHILSMLNYKFDLILIILNSSTTGAAKRDANTAMSPEDNNDSIGWKLSANWWGESSSSNATNKPTRSLSPSKAAAGRAPLSAAPAKKQATGSGAPSMTISSLPHPAPHAAARKPRSPAKKRPPTSTAPSSARSNASSSKLTDENQNSKQHGAPSPGALLRMQSAATHPAPHPIPELTRLTSPRHLEPMSTIIHSMASLSRAGCERSQRKTNQDSCFAFRQYVQPHQAIAGVLDGHGPHGHGVSGFIKQQLPMVIAEQLRSKGEAAAGAALRAAFLEVQSSLRSSKNAPNSRLSGSTVVVSLLQGRKLTTAWVGDSRAVLVRREMGGGYRGIALTVDHKPNSAGELSRILAAGGRVERLSDGFGREVGPQRVWLPSSWVPGLAMSRALGDFVAHSGKLHFLIVFSKRPSKTV